MPAPSSLVIIGNWDRHKRPPGNGFGVFRFDAETGEMELASTAGLDLTIGCAVLSSDGQRLYAVDEYTILPGLFQGGGGQLVGFRLDRERATLTEFTRTPSFGSLPSFVTLGGNERFCLVTHHTDRVPVTRVRRGPDGAYNIAMTYDDATTVLFPLDDDGTIAPPSDVILHEGAGGPLKRQTHPQLHAVTTSPSGALFAVTDKGNDRTHLFRIDTGQRKLVELGTRFVSEPGSSPRYTAWHPFRPFLFLNHETKALVSSLRYTEDGEIAHVGTWSVLAPGQNDEFELKQSDIKVHPSGKYIYTGIRGTSEVVALRIAQETGRLERFQAVTLDGKGPRGFAISPNGRFMVVAAHDSQLVLVWRIMPDGTLEPTGHRYPQPNPGTVTFA
jgi:6-phosphogluconolactonase